MKHMETAYNFLIERMGEYSPDAFEIYACRTEELTIEAKDQKVESFLKSQNEGIAVRLVKKNKIAMSSTSDLTENSLIRLITNALNIAGKTGDSEEAFLPGPIVHVPALAERPGRPLNEISEKEKIDVALAVEKAALGSHKSVVRARQPSYREYSKTILVTNSCGVSEKFQRGLVFADVQAVAEGKGTTETAYETRHHTRFEDLDYEYVGRSAGLRAAAQLGASSMKTGVYRACFAPRAAASMLRIFIPSFFADNVRRKKSLLAGKKGEELFSKKISVIDDGLLPIGAGSFLFDDEGVACQKTVVVDSGVVRSWLYDGANANLDGVASTGNASRLNIHNPPQIAVSNCFVAEGGRTQKDLISACENGILVTDLLGLHTANSISGDFSLGATGFMIEKGEIVRPVRKIIAAGNVRDFFKDVESVGSDLEFFGLYGAPSLMVPRLQINGDN